MERKVIFRDRQEFQAADANNIQAFVSTSLEHTRNDALVNGTSFYWGLASTKYSTTEVQVQKGRLWSAEGKLYVREIDTSFPDYQASIFSVLQYVPAQYERAVALLAYGQEIDTSLEPRDYLIDVSSRITEPQVVAMNKARVMQVTLLAGDESPVPQVPAIPSGSVHFATVYIKPSGIDRVVMNEDTRLPNLPGLDAAIDQLEAWRQLISNQIETLQSDITNIRNLLNDLPVRQELAVVAKDVARVKERVDLGDDFANYAADTFGTDDESDAAQTGYSARIQNGLMFGLAASTTQALALLNPSDPLVTRSANNLILPKYSSVQKFAPRPYNGDTPLAAQTTSYTTKKIVISQWVHQYGWSYNQYAEWWVKEWNAGRPLGENGLSFYSYGALWSLKWSQYWTLRDVEQYVPELTTSTIVGATVAQTFLVSNAFWMTGLSLFFTSIGATGDVTVAICETDLGKPNLKRSLAVATVAVGSLQAYPSETKINFEPIYLKSGQRYAIVVSSQGDHRLATVAGQEYLEGTFFLGTDSDYTIGDVSKDLMFALYGAEFERNRVEVALNAISLSGGMSDLLLKTTQFVPEGMDLSFEVQVGGVWHSLSEQTDHLSGLPDLVPMRAVFVGTSSIMPAMRLDGSTITASRSETSTIHWSTLRQLASASSNIKVSLYLDKFSDADHTITCQLVEPNSTIINPAATQTRTETTDVGGNPVVQKIFTFTPGSAIDEYRIKLTMGRNSGLKIPYVVLERVDVAS